VTTDISSPRVCGKEVFPRRHFAEWAMVGPWAGVEFLQSTPPFLRMGKGGYRKRAWIFSTPPFLGIGNGGSVGMQFLHAACHFSEWAMMELGDN